MNSFVDSHFFAGIDDKGFYRYVIIFLSQSAVVLFSLTHVDN